MSPGDSVGQPLDRIDGRLKVTGAATYAAEYAVAGVLYGALVSSSIARGRVVSIDARAALALPGVVAVFTPANMPRIPGAAEANPPATRVLSLLQDDLVHYNGQPIAVVVGRSLEETEEAARALPVHYEVEPGQTDFANAKVHLVKPKSMQGEEADSMRGQGAAALAGAWARLDRVYSTPFEFHNPIEPHATIAHWEDDRLTLYDSTQYVSGVRTSVAKALGIPAEKIRVVCRYTGGGFGSKGSTWSHVVLAAACARELGRPLKLVLERPQMFAPVGGRPRTEQSLALACDTRGQLVAMRHDVISSTSLIEDWTEPSAVVTRMLYETPNLETSHRLARMNVGTPTFMRAPGEASGSFALEVAMDELAVQLGQDPIQLRLNNYAQTDAGKGLPFSSKALDECYAQGARVFDWARRTPAPRSMQVGDERIGLGMATATYPARRSKAQALARLNADGTLLVRTGSQDLGTGTYTIMTQVAADAAGLPVSRVRFELGDTDFPTAPVSGGSQTAASVGPAVAAAARDVANALIDMARRDSRSPLYGSAAERLTVSQGWVVDRDDASRRDAATEIVARAGGRPIEALAEAAPGAEKEALSMHSFGAVFAEVHVDEMLGIVRVEHIVGVYDVGRLLNQKTARSQLLGGVVWGIGMALTEAGQFDARYGRMVNNNLAEYHVPCNADIHRIDVMALDRPDERFNPLGARGIGEIGITGVAAAISNAIFHATGRRLRDLPFTPDRILA